MKKKLFVRIALFIIMLFVLDNVVGMTSAYLIKNAKSGATEKIEHICNKSNEDVLIFGSSRGCHHYDPRILRDSLSMSVYNCAYDGCGSILLYGLLEILTDHYTPKCIIYDVQPSFDYLVDGQENSRFLGNLKPYYESEGIDSIFWNIDPNERWKMLSHMYRMNGKTIQVVSEYFMKRNETIMGYDPRDRKMQVEPKVINSTDVAPFDETKKYYFERIISLCQEKGIKLIFYASPYYKKTTDNEFMFIKNLSDKYGIPFFNHSCDSNFTNNRDWFYDSIHMNVDGATVYSQVVAKELSEIK